MEHRNHFSTNNMNKKDLHKREPLGIVVLCARYLQIVLLTMFNYGMDNWPHPAGFQGMKLLTHPYVIIDQPNWVGAVDTIKIFEFPDGLVRPPLK